MNAGGGDAGQSAEAMEACRKELAEAYRRYCQDARQGQPAPADPSREELDREYSRLEKRWRLARQQIRRAFPKEGGFVEAQLPGLHVELKLAAEQAARTYALLSALDRAQVADQMLEGGKYPLVNAGPLEVGRVLDELDAARRQPPPYCYVVTAVYGPHSREAMRAHARCGPVFRHGGAVLRGGWRAYQRIGPPLARFAARRPLVARWLLRPLLARPIVAAAGEPGMARFAARAYLTVLAAAARPLAAIARARRGRVPR